ncbi:amino acid ABC transporter permease [Microbacterium sp. USHLN186]|uniref:amino acid ABC transporter permease n=1 Tax=Microbacterium sp. USHLN186 TaxID=3081286 RepID=UPI0030176613
MARSNSSAVFFGEEIGRIKPERHVTRWIGTALVLLIAVLLLQSMMTNPNYQWDVVFRYFTSTQVLLGLLKTVELTVVSMVLGTLLGSVLAVMRLSSVVVFRAAAAFYVWVFRATPLLVQLIILYNLAALYPDLAIHVPFGPEISINMNELLTPYLVAVLAFSLNEAAYMCEIIRGGIMSVDPGQTEAAKALGMTSGRIRTRIVFPQAMRFIIPPSGSQVISMLKGTSIISVIAFSELLYTVQVIYTRTFETIPLLIVAALWYLLVTSVLMVAQGYIEKHYSRGFDGKRAPTKAEGTRTAAIRAIPLTDPVNVVPISPETKAGLSEQHAGTREGRTHD